MSELPNSARDSAPPIGSGRS